jgi:hypothetical protein
MLSLELADLSAIGTDLSTLGFTPLVEAQIDSQAKAHGILRPFIRRQHCVTDKGIK